MLALDHVEVAVQHARGEARREEVAERAVEARAARLSGERVRRAQLWRLLARSWPPRFGPFRDGRRSLGARPSFSGTRNARVEGPVPAPAPRGIEARALAVEAAHEAVRE